jgi:hypothetical protein
VLAASGAASIVQGDVDAGWSRPKPGQLIRAHCRPVALVLVLAHFRVIGRCCWLRAVADSEPRGHVRACGADGDRRAECAPLNRYGNSSVTLKRQDDTRRTPAHATCRLQFGLQSPRVRRRLHPSALPRYLDE